MTRVTAFGNGGLWHDRARQHEPHRPAALAIGMVLVKPPILFKNIDVRCRLQVHFFARTFFAFLSPLNSRLPSSHSAMTIRIESAVLTGSCYPAKARLPTALVDSPLFPG